MSIADLKNSATARMQKSANTLKDALSKLRTGRANTAMLDHLRVEYYGNQVPLNQVANVAVADGRTITITPWEKPIMTSDLGLMPNTAGNIIRVPMPSLTEERRKEIIKVAKQEAETARVSV